MPEWKREDLGGGVYSALALWNTLVRIVVRSIPGMADWQTFPSLTFVIGPGGVAPAAAFTREEIAAGVFAASHFNAGRYFYSKGRASSLMLGRHILEAWAARTLDLLGQALGQGWGQGWATGKVEPDEFEGEGLSEGLGEGFVFMDPEALQARGEGRGCGYAFWWTARGEGYGQGSADPLVVAIAAALSEGRSTSLVLVQAGVGEPCITDDGELPPGGGPYTYVF